MFITRFGGRCENRCQKDNHDINDSSGPAVGHHITIIRILGNRYHFIQIPKLFRFSWWETLQSTISTWWKIYCQQRFLLLLLVFVRWSHYDIAIYDKLLSRKLYPTTGHWHVGYISLCSRFTGALDSAYIQSLIKVMACRMIGAKSIFEQTNYREHLLRINAVNIDGTSLSSYTPFAFCGVLLRLGSGRFDPYLSELRINWHWNKNPIGSVPVWGSLITYGYKHHRYSL